MALVLSPAAALAFPGFFVGKSAAKRVNHETHVVIMHKGDRTVVSLALDYDGPLDDFAIVMPVPADVTVDHVKTLRRESVDRVTELSAPRFHEFWETDPCDTCAGAAGVGAQQEGDSCDGLSRWRQHARGDREGAARDAHDRQAEFKRPASSVRSLLSESDAKDVAGWLKQQRLRGARGRGEATSSSTSRRACRCWSPRSTRKKIELAGGGRAVLSPVRFWTEKPFDTLATRLGLYDMATSRSSTST